MGWKSEGETQQDRDFHLDVCGELETETTSGWKGKV